MKMSKRQNVQFLGELSLKTFFFFKHLKTWKYYWEKVLVSFVCHAVIFFVFKAMTLRHLKCDLKGKVHLKKLPHDLLTQRSIQDVGHGVSSSENMLVSWEPRFVNSNQPVSFWLILKSSDFTNPHFVLPIYDWCFWWLALPRSLPHSPTSSAGTPHSRECTYVS